MAQRLLPRCFGLTRPSLTSVEGFDVLEFESEQCELIKGEVLRMYQEVVEHPEEEFHFFHGRAAADLFGYERDWLDLAPEGAVASFAGW